MNKILPITDPAQGQGREKQVRFTPRRIKPYCCVSVSQSLLLLAHLIRNGSERVVTSAREHLYDLRSLESYHFVGKVLFTQVDMINKKCFYFSNFAFIR